MNYLTNHYRHQVEILSQKVALLENKLASMNRVGPEIENTGYGSQGSSVPETAGPGVNFPNAYQPVDFNATGQTPTFSGAILGQLLAAGNMQAVYQYLSQFYGDDMTTIAAILSSYGIPTPAGVAPSETGSAPGAQPFSGAQLGQLLGQGNMNAVNQYLGQFGGQYPTQAGPAAVSTGMNAPRTARRGAGRSARGQ